MIYIIADLNADLTQFIMKGIQRKDVVLVHYPAKTNGIVQKIRRGLESIIPKIPCFIYCPNGLAQWRKRIIRDDHVLLFSIMNPKDLWILRKYLNTKNVHLYLWNPIMETGGNPTRSEQRLQAIQATTSGRVLTFDAQDAQDYGFSLVPQPFRHMASPSDPAETIDYDFCFIGIDKGRLPFLKKFKLEAEKNGFRCFFHIIPEKDRAYSSEDQKFLCTDYLSYADNLRHAARSNCLLEIVQAHQVGGTMRGVEALFLHKKLITTRSLARREPGFDDRRVLVLDSDSTAEMAIPMEAIRAFMAKPLGAQDEASLQAHEINAWLDHVSAAGSSSTPPHEHLHSLQPRPAHQ